MRLYTASSHAGVSFYSSLLPISKPSSPDKVWPWSNTRYQACLQLDPYPKSSMSSFRKAMLKGLEQPPGPVFGHDIDQTTSTLISSDRAEEIEQTEESIDRPTADIVMPRSIMQSLKQDLGHTETMLQVNVNPPASDIDSICNFEYGNNPGLQSLPRSTCYETIVPKLRGGDGKYWKRRFRSLLSTERRQRRSISDPLPLPNVNLGTPLLRSPTVFQYLDKDALNKGDQAKSPKSIEALPRKHPLWRRRAWRTSLRRQIGTYIDVVHEIELTVQQINQVQAEMDFWGGLRYYRSLIQKLEAEHAKEEPNKTEGHREGSNVVEARSEVRAKMIPTRPKANGIVKPSLP